MTGNYYLAKMRLKALQQQKRMIEKEIRKIKKVIHEAAS